MNTTERSFTSESGVKIKLLLLLLLLPATLVAELLCGLVVQSTVVTRRLYQGCLGDENETYRTTLCRRTDLADAVDLEIICSVSIDLSDGKFALSMQPFYLEG